MDIRQWIVASQGYKRQHGLRRMEVLMELLENPQKELSIIHVTGTNGKGSTITFLSALFQNHGFTTGAFVSPHLIDYTDRFLVNGQAMPEKLFQRIGLQVKQASEALQETWGHVSFFEVMTAMAFLYFKEQQVDVALIEVGIGGLLDTTNIIIPQVSVITSLGMDHEEMLGKTEEAIMIQKTGIIKENRPVVVGKVSPIAQQVAKIVSEAYHSPLFLQKRDFDIQDIKKGYLFETKEWKCEIPTIRMLGSFQVDNAAVALETFRVYMQQNEVPLEEKKIQQAFQRANWPARMEKIHDKPLVVLDGAHNLHAMNRFVETVQSMKNNIGKQTILFSALQRKAYHEMIAYLHQTVPNVQLILTTFDFPGAMTLQEFPDEETTMDASTYVMQFIENAGADDQLFVTGSLYFLSDVRKKFHEKK